VAVLYRISDCLLFVFWEIFVAVKEIKVVFNCTLDILDHLWRNATPGHKSGYFPRSKGKDSLPMFVLETLKIWAGYESPKAKLAFEDFDSIVFALLVLTSRSIVWSNL